MRSFITLALLAGSALAAYAPGTACKNNNDCKSNCDKSQWIIAAKSDGSYQFVCDPAVTDTQYYSSACGEKIPEERDQPDQFFYDQAATAKACKSVGGGLSCDGGCVSSGKRSDEQSFINSWRGLCQKKLLGIFDNVGYEIKNYDSEVEAKEAAKCS
jgi:hypothetical protein